MGGVGVRTLVVAQLLVAVGAGLVVAAVWLLLGVAFALLVAGVLAIGYGLLLVEVPARGEVEVPEPGVVPLGRAGASRAGR